MIRYFRADGGGRLLMSCVARGRISQSARIQNEKVIVRSTGEWILLRIRVPETQTRRYVERGGGGSKENPNKHF